MQDDGKMLYIEAQEMHQMMMCFLDSMVNPESIERITSEPSQISGKTTYNI